MQIKIEFWLIFILFVATLLGLDLFMFHKKDKAISIKSALWWSLFWIGLAAVFNIGIYFTAGAIYGEAIGQQKALEFLTGYLIEESLSVDNLFVFILIFGFFKIDPKFQHKILFWGVIGAIVMRAIFIFAGVALLNRFDWIMYIFGAILVYSGIHLLLEKKDQDDFDPGKNIVIRWFKKIFPVTEDLTSSFFIRKNHIIYATPLFITLLLIEVSDLIFAVDSIPAVLSVSKDVFIVYTSNIFAILGLRSLYFALNGIVDYFHYLRYALAGILTFIGLKMAINELSMELGYTFHISNIFSLLTIVTLLMVSVLFSVIYKSHHSKQ
ncbi:MAG: TerC family protein [Paludibacter sp.]|nr:TerC family protein [Paludibacter sp.]